MKTIKLKNINTENVSVFDIQHTHRALQSSTETTSSELHDNLCNYFDFVKREKFDRVGYWKDQDGGVHIIFVPFTSKTVSRDEYDIFDDRMDQFYNRIYCSGDMCCKTTALVSSSELLAYHVTGMEKAKVSIMTVVSFLMCYMGRDDLMVMRYLCDFIYSEN